jgi:hypothetical protein
MPNDFWAIFDEHLGTFEVCDWQLPCLHPAAIHIHYHLRRRGFK